MAWKVFAMCHSYCIYSWDIITSRQMWRDTDGNSFIVMTALEVPGIQEILRERSETFYVECTNSFMRLYLYLINMARLNILVFLSQIVLVQPELITVCCT